MERKNSDFFGGLFDINRDGVTDIGEQALAFMMFEELMEDDEDSEDFDDDDDDF